MLSALTTLIEPMAALAVAHGTPLSAVQDIVKLAFVDAARRAHPTLTAHGMVSRISTVTGLNRREVSRITQLDRAAVPARHSPASQVAARWQADPTLQDPSGVPMALPRQGPAPSFESLVHAVTRDVHPRSLLDELSRLGRVQLEGETVRLTGKLFVPQGDAERMLGLLGNNVGDHLRAAVANVISPVAPYLEQAVFADGLSPQSADEVEKLARTQWQVLLATMLPSIQKMIVDDEAADRPRDNRVRIGLYSYKEATTPAPAPPAPPARKRKPARPKEA